LELTGGKNIWLSMTPQSKVSLFNWISHAWPEVPIEGAALKKALIKKGEGIGKNAPRMVAPTTKRENITVFSGLPHLYVADKSLKSTAPYDSKEYHFSYNKPTAEDVSDQNPDEAWGQFKKLTASQLAKVIRECPQQIQPTGEKQRPPVRPFHPTACTLLRSSTLPRHPPTHPPTHPPRSTRGAERHHWRRGERQYWR
jgi:hypothetical protein